MFHPAIFGPPRGQQFGFCSAFIFWINFKTTGVLMETWQAVKLRYEWLISEGGLVNVDNIEEKLLYSLFRCSTKN